MSGAGLLDGGEGDDTLKAVATVGAENTTTLTGGAGVNIFEVGYGFDPADHGTDGVPYQGLYDHVKITDFGDSSSLVINVPNGYSGGIAYGEGADGVFIVIDKSGLGVFEGVAILEGVSADDFRSDKVTFNYY